MTEQQVQSELGDGVDLRAELVAAMKLGYSMRGDGLLPNMAAAVLAAGWVPPETVTAARSETAERIAAEIEAAMDGGRRMEPFWAQNDDGMARAVRIARGFS